MGQPVRGDVVVLPFPYSNLAASKRRPALVIAKADPHGDVILCMITSQNTRDACAVPLVQSDFANGSLPLDSNARPNRLFTADTSIIIRKAGHLTPEKLDAVVAAIIDIIASGQESEPTSTDR